MLSIKKSFNDINLFNSRTTKVLCFAIPILLMLMASLNVDMVSFVHDNTQLLKQYPIHLYSIILCISVISVSFVYLSFLAILSYRVAYLKIKNIINKTK